MFVSNQSDISEILRYGHADMANLLTAATARSPRPAHISPASLRTEHRAHLLVAFVVACMFQWLFYMLCCVNKGLENEAWRGRRRHLAHPRPRWRR